VYWIPGYPGPPAPGPLQRPSFGPRSATKTEAQQRRPSRGGASWGERRWNAKDKKSFSRGTPREERDQIYDSSAQSCVGEGIRSEESVLPRLPRQGGDQLCRACIKLHGGCCFPPKNRVDGAGRQRRTSAFLHPLPCTGATTLRRPRPPKPEDIQLSRSLAVLWQPLPQVDEGKEDLGAIKGGEAAP
jgi:hypothetical protein